MPNLNSPSRSLSDEGSLDGLLSLALRKQSLETEDMLPAEIVSWDASANRAQVRILYQITMTNGAIYPMEAPAEIPTFVAGGGGFLLVFPLQPGDLGWIKSNDRDISLFLQEYNAQPGVTPRTHSFEDAVFIPDAMTGFVQADIAGACLQTKDGTTSVIVGNNAIVLKAGSTELTITEENITSNKPIIAPQFMSAGGLNLVGHTHTNPEGGDVGTAINP